MQRLCRKRTDQRGDLGVGWPVEHPHLRHRGGAGARLHDRCHPVERQIPLPAGDVAHQSLEQAGKQRGGQLVAVGLQRVEQLDGPPPRIVPG